MNIEYSLALISFPTEPAHCLRDHTFTLHQLIISELVTQTLYDSMSLIFEFTQSK